MDPISSNIYKKWHIHIYMMAKVKKVMGAQDFYKQIIENHDIIVALSSPTHTPNQENAIIVNGYGPTKCFLLHLYLTFSLKWRLKGIYNILPFLHYILITTM